MWLILILLLVLIYFLTKERFCYKIDSLESILHGDLSSRKFETIKLPARSQETDLKAAFGYCWEPNQMRALIDNSPTQTAVCDKYSDCSKYMHDGYILY
jgi:hypothetical protein